MMRPFWSGQFRVSLVSFGIQLFPATEARSEIHFHQLNRKTGERIRHQNVSGDQGPVHPDEIVKGYEYSKGQYVMIEPGDIENLRIPSRQTFEVTQFIDRKEIDPEYLEKPYFVTPQNPSQAEAFAVVRKAMQSSGKVALGKIAFGGREHLIAIAAPQDDELLGMMAYTMRYAEELRKPEEYFDSIKKVNVPSDQLQLATELIKRKAAKFQPDKFKDEYETALRDMVEAKVKHAPVPKDKPAPRSNNVVNLMDALRKSVQGMEGGKDATPPQAPAKKRSQAPSGRSNKIALVKPAASTARKSRRKSA